jgi:hypothetical protein
MMNSNSSALLTRGGQEPASISSGACNLPVLYRDGSMLGLVYRVDPVLAMDLVRGLPLEPVVVFGEAIASLCVFEYRDTTLGSYNEICLGIQVKRSGSSPSLLRALWDMRSVDDTGLLILTLPVTTEQAYVAGVELWGYPKYISNIDTAFRADGVQTTLRDEFTLSHSRRFGLRSKGFPFITYTVLNQRLIRTVVEVEHRVRYGGAATVQLRVVGEGPTSNIIRKLALDTLVPSVAFRTDALKTVLPLGKDIGTATGEG